MTPKIRKNETLMEKSSLIVMKKVLNIHLNKNVPAVRQTGADCLVIIKNKMGGPGIH